jgi:tetratricopeptide (TPR) repeat protein
MKKQFRMLLIAVLAASLGAIHLAACGASTPTAGTTSASTSAAPDSDPGPLSEGPLGSEGIAQLYLAIHAIDAGKHEQAIEILESLAERIPGHRDVVHELALAYRMKGEPLKAVALLRPYETHLDAQMAAALGSAYSEAGDFESALKSLGRSLERHPTSGLLYSEVGTVLRLAGKSLEAIEMYELGMKVEPAWPSNYLNAAQIYSNSNFRGNTLIYGEIFRILEPRSERSAKLAVLMVDTMHEAVKIEKKSDTEGSAAVSFAPNPKIKLDTGSGKPGLWSQFPLVNLYELTYGVSLTKAMIDGLTLATLHRAKEQFLEMWWGERGMHQHRDFPLASWLRRLREAGHLEAYEHWLYGPAFREEHDLWQAGHQADLDSLQSWMRDNPLFNPDAPGGERGPEGRI